MLLRVYGTRNPKRLALRSMLPKGKLKSGIVSTKLTKSETFVLWPDIQNKWNATGKSGKQCYSYIFYIVYSWIHLFYSHTIFNLSFHYEATGTHFSFRCVCYFACSSNPRLTCSYITFIIYRFIQVDLFSSRHGKVIAVVM